MKLPQKNINKRTCKEIINRGLFPIPNEILLNSKEYQPFPVKWKFVLFIYIAVLIAEFILWLVLYKYCLSTWKYTNIHNDNQTTDIRIRYCVFLSINLMVSIPLICYVILPLLTNRIFVKFAYKRVDNDQDNLFILMAKCITYWLRNGIDFLEYFDQNQLIAYQVAQHAQNVQNELRSIELYTKN